MRWKRSLQNSCPWGVGELTPKQLVMAMVHRRLPKGISICHRGLRRFGADEGSVEALALAIRSPELVRFCEMRVRSEAQAQAHLREIERRRQMRDSGGEPSGNTAAPMLKAPAPATDIGAPPQA